jgi:hypothetical protein
MSEQARTIRGEEMLGLGITLSKYTKLCLSAFENLPADTGVTIDDIDSVLTWCLPEYNRLKAAHPVPADPFADKAAQRGG